jgi:hypothetical protein
LITRAVPRDRIGVTQHLTAVFAVKPDEAAALPVALALLGHPGPFTLVDGVRHARLVVLDGLPGDGRRNWRLRPRPPVAYLLFSVAYEGTLETLVAAMLEAFGDQLDEVFGRCEGFPADRSPAAVADFVHRHRHRGLITFSTYRASVAEIGRALALQQAMVAIVGAAPELDVATLRARLAEVPA